MNERAYGETAFPADAAINSEVTEGLTKLEYFTARVLPSVIESPKYEHFSDREKVEKAIALAKIAIDKLNS